MKKCCLCGKNDVTELVKSGETTYFSGGCIEVTRNKVLHLCLHLFGREPCTVICKDCGDSLSIAIQVAAIKRASEIKKGKDKK